MTRWQYAALALPWGLVCLWLWHKQGVWRQRWKHGALGVGVGLFLLTPQIIYTAQHPDPAFSHEWLQGWSPANAFGRDFVTADGTFHYDLSIGAYYLAPLTSPYYLNTLFVPLIAFGAIFVVVTICYSGARRRPNASLEVRTEFLPSEKGSVTKAPTPITILLFGWVIMQYGFLAGIPYQNIRFPLSFFPPLIVLGGLGLAWLLSSLARLQTPLRIGLIAVVVGTITYGLITTGSVASGLISGFVANKDRDLAAVRWAESLILEPSATIYTLDLALTVEHYSTLRPVQIYYETPTSMAARLPGDLPAYALFNVSATENQWQGKTPWLIYHWLLDQPGMSEIGQYNVYTLYRVK
jgi:hypothetical protein